MIMIIILREEVGLRSQPTSSPPIFVDLYVNLKKLWPSVTFDPQKSQSTYTYRLTKMQFLSLYESDFQQSLTNTQVQTLKILGQANYCPENCKNRKISCLFSLAH